MQLDDADTTVALRKRRMAVSFMAALGERSTAEECHALETGNEQAKWVVARALPVHAGEAAVTCLSADTGHADPAVRAAALTGLRLLMGAGKVPPPQAWERVEPLTRDPDPRVRAGAAEVVAMFDWAHAIPTLTAMQKDPDPAVADTVRRTLESLRSYRFMNPDKTY